jgi:hypothetical protein
MKRNILPVFLVSALLGFAQLCHAQHLKKLPDAVAHKKIISVGSFNFDQLDLHYELAVDRCYGDTLAGLEAVIKQVYHQEPPPGVLQLKAKWIDETTKDSARLDCIKDIFGKDTASYYRLVVSPTLIDPRLHQYFSVDTTVQKFARDTIEMFWRLVRADPSKLDKLAPDTVRINKGTKATSELQKMGAVPVSDDPLVEKVIGHLKEGQLWSNVVEDDQSYKIVKLLYQTSSYYYCRILTVQKRPFDPWFKEVVLKQVPIVFQDKQLLEMIKVRFPGVWWLEKAKFVL